MPSATNPEAFPFNKPLAQAWIERCVSTHDRCNIHTTGAWYPTHLLQLKHHGRAISLVVTDTHKPTGRYATLSHRWGPHKYRQLTTETIDEFQNAIELSALPTIFQDAISVVHDLGIQYIWIDALCIKQDADLVDWNLEAPKMHKVYAHSFLTISATSSADDGSGSLFSNATSRTTPPPPLVQANVARLVRHRRAKNRARNSRRQSPTSYRKLQLLSKQYYLVNGHVWSDEIEETPLQNRGWVFQERVLSSRNLHFGPTQLAWECQETSALENFKNEIPPGITETSKSGIVAGAMAPQLSGRTQETFRKSWGDLVAQYSRCGLTKSEDKLIAFSGVAQMIEEARNDQYIAGLWKSTLVTDLAWRRLSNAAPSCTGYSPRAPSWSWLSVDGEVHFAPPDKPTFFASIISHPGKDLAGSKLKIAEGNILIEGVLLPLDSIEMNKDVVESFSVGGVRILDGWSAEESHLDLDDSRYESMEFGQKEVLFILPLFSGKTSLFTLVIAKKNEDEYRRVGSAQLQIMKMDFHLGKASRGWQSLPRTQQGERRTVPMSVNISTVTVLRMVAEQRKQNRSQVIRLV